MSIASSRHSQGALSTSSSRAALLDAKASALASQLKAQQVAEETTFRAKEDELISQQRLEQQKQQRDNVAKLKQNKQRSKEIGPIVRPRPKRKSYYLQQPF